MKPSFPHFIGVMSANAATAGLGLLMLPMAVGALAKNGVDSQTLGLLAFLELGGSALTSILVSTRVDRWDPLRLCVLGAMLYAVGNFVSAGALGLVPVLLAARLVVGIGTGLIYVGSLAISARLRNPESIYGYTGMAPCVSALAGFALAPWLIEISGAAGVFAFQGAIALLTALVTFSQRKTTLAFVELDLADGPTVDTGLGHAPAPKERLDARTAIFGIASLFLLSLADAAVWAFVAPIGEVSGISLAQMSNVLIVSSIIGCFGPLLAAWIGDRFGLMAPIIIGQACMISLSLVMVLTHSPSIYIAAVLVRVFAILFLQPRYSGLYARVDPLGRLVAASAGFSAVGYAVGPLVGGMLASVEHHAFARLGVLGSSCAAVSLMATLLLVAHRRAALKQTEMATPATA